MSDITFAVAPFDAPVSAELTEAVQQEYMVRYGQRDATVITAAEFAPPQGIFVIGWDVDQPIACGGVRLVEPGVGELKRMYVAPHARRRGIARRLLHKLEGEAVVLGATTLRLETGLHQPEAIALYDSEGYIDVEPFGHYACHPLARHLAKTLDAAKAVDDGANAVDDGAKAVDDGAKAEEATKRRG
jgi:GNAT superfamily N-acetyltransferase